MNKKIASSLFRMSKVLRAGKVFSFDFGEAIPDQQGGVTFKAYFDINQNALAGIPVEDLYEKHIKWVVFHANQTIWNKITRPAGVKKTAYTKANIIDGQLVVEHKYNEIGSLNDNSVPSGWRLIGHFQPELF